MQFRVDELKRRFLYELVLVQPHIKFTSATWTIVIGNISLAVRTVICILIRLHTSTHWPQNVITNYGFAFEYQIRSAAQWQTK